jgi:DNA-binding SARP family transcriptional activator
MVAITSAPQLLLLGGFTVLLHGREIFLPSHAQRVLVGLCVGRPVHLPQPRTTLAERLWSDSTLERAQASLRTALWRIRQADSRLVISMHDQVRLGPEVQVDMIDSLAQADRLLTDGDELLDDDMRIEPLVLDLLPGWEDDWLLLERERVRQMHLQALEALSSRLYAVGKYGRAVQAALAAVSIEPLRESAYDALITAHLGQGNVGEAHRQYQRYAQILWDELRLTPSRPFEQVIAGYPGSPRRPTQVPNGTAGSGRRMVVGSRSAVDLG